MCSARIECGSSRSRGASRSSSVACTIFFFQAEDGIRDVAVTGVQTCALPILSVSYAAVELAKKIFQNLSEKTVLLVGIGEMGKLAARHLIGAGVRHVMIANRNYEHAIDLAKRFDEIGRASCRERV